MLPTVASRALTGLLLALAAGSSAVAVRVLLAERDRRALLARLAMRRGALEGLSPAHGVGGTRWERFAYWLDRRLPRWLLPNDGGRQLASAGYPSEAARPLYALGRLLAPFLGLALTLPLAGGRHGVGPFLATALGLTMGVALPSAALSRLVARRQGAIRRALPDAIDLLIVCLEAGVGIDAALLRVARELERAHPELAEELSAVNRRVGAGLPRDEALRGMYARTGIDEVRALTATLVQAERLGTAFGRVLRIHADGMRTRRRQLAEARAAQASVKMIFPLVLLLLPAFFAVVLGPAIMSLSTTFGKP